MNYKDFLESKRLTVKAVGKEVRGEDIHPALFHFQRDLVKWAVRKGRSAIFADTGLGKTIMQVEWARLIGKRTLILAPLSIARQTVQIAREVLDVEVHYTRSGDDLIDGINITNYEMVDHFNPADFSAVVLDESSILKAFNGTTRRKLTTLFTDTPFKLCCTATPAPNDTLEIGRHSEFLGVMRNGEMLSAFFVHDSKSPGSNGRYRLKGHAEAAFFRWLASWGMSVRKPSDLGYDDDGYNLPPLEIKPIYVETGYVPEGMLFFIELKGIKERAEVRRATMEERCQESARLVNADDEQWVVWVGLNDEGRRMAELISDSVLVEGSQSPEDKAAALEAFQDGKHRVLITKPRIAGFGMNFQQAHKMVFVGMDDSWEMYYQAIRRMYRFKQEKTVQVYLVLADVQVAIYENVMEKEAKANEMRERLIANVSQFERDELLDLSTSDWQYEEKTSTGQGWVMMLGDSVERIKEIEDDSIGHIVYSPPFNDLFTYTPTERDLGNARDLVEFFKHYDYIIRETLRVLMPGRTCAVHAENLLASKTHHGYIGMIDFRGEIIRAHQKAGWIYVGEITIDKDPQVQAIRTKNHRLLFVTLGKDSARSRPGLADYLLLFEKPGENPTPIDTDVTTDQWIQWAHPVWTDIKETDVLNTVVAKADSDERHICPLQLGVIERCVRLWSNKGEKVLSPFAGIGSEGYEALKHGREFVGIELKPEYFNVAVRNLTNAELATRQVDLFERAAAQAEVEASLSGEVVP